MRHTFFHLKRKKTEANQQCTASCLMQWTVKQMATACLLATAEWHDIQFKVTLYYSSQAFGLEPNKDLISTCKDQY